MDRRACIKLGSLAAGAWLAGPACLRPTPERGGRAGEPSVAPSIRDNLGIQTFTVRALLDADPVGTLRALAGIGYRELEMVGFGGSIFLDDPLYGHSPRAFKMVLDDLGLRVPTTQFSGQAENLAEIADTVTQIGVAYMVEAMAGEFLSVTPDGPVVSGVTDLDQVKRVADRLNARGEICRRSGVGFAYHNHHMEFVSVDGRVAYDVLIENTDAELVALELDAGWTKVAGVDAHEYLERFPGRYIACHLKDFDASRPLGARSARSPIPEMTQLVPPGDGTVDHGRLLAAMDRTGVRHGYVEVDLPDDALDAARRGYAYLRSLDYRV